MTGEAAAGLRIANRRRPGAVLGAGKGRGKKRGNARPDGVRRAPGDGRITSRLFGGLELDSRMEQTRPHSRTARVGQQMKETRPMGSGSSLRRSARPLGAPQHERIKRETRPRARDGTQEKSVAGLRSALRAGRNTTRDRPPARPAGP